MQRITCYDAASGKIKNRIRGRYPVEVKCQNLTLLLTILFYVCDVALFHVSSLLSSIITVYSWFYQRILPILTYDAVVVVAASVHKLNVVQFVGVLRIGLIPRKLKGGLWQGLYHIQR